MNGKPQLKQLNNGLRYIVSPMPGIKSVSVMALVKAGTKYETEDNNGISHFLEHIVFKGTKKYKDTLALSLDIDNVGGSFNAFTDKEYTAFYVKVAVDHIDLAMQVVSELIFHPTIPEKDMEIEKGVIVEEMRMYEDEPKAKIAREFEKVMFSPTPLGWKTLGTEKNIKEMKKQDFVDYMDYMYVPNRIVLSVAGGEVNSKRFTVDSLIAKYFSKEKNNVELKQDLFTFDQTKPRELKIAKDTEQTHLIYGYRTFGRGHKNRYVMSILSTILGNGMSSRWFTEIREKRGLAYYVGSNMNMYCDGGYLAVRAGCKPEMAGEVIKLAEAEWESLKKKNVDDKELKKAKEYLKGHLLLGLESSNEVANFFGEDMLIKDEMRSIKDVMKGIDAVSVDDVKRLANTIAINAGRNMAIIGPEKSIKDININN